MPARQQALTTHKHSTWWMLKTNQFTSKARTAETFADCFFIKAVTLNGISPTLLVSPALSVAWVVVFESTAYVRCHAIGRASVKIASGAVMKERSPEVLTSRLYPSWSSMTAPSCAMVTHFLLPEPDPLPETWSLLLLSVDQTSDVNTWLLLLLVLVLLLMRLRLLLLWGGTSASDWSWLPEVLTGGSEACVTEEELSVADETAGLGLNQDRMPAEHW